jgi:hypothetical protein
MATRKQEERRITHDFCCWFRSIGGSRLPVSRVGDRLVREADLRATRLARPTHSEGLEGYFGNPNKITWQTGIPDLIGEKAGETWIIEVKEAFTIGSVAESLGQLLLYEKLYRDDTESSVRCRLAATFGKVAPGRTWGGELSHGELVLDEVASFLRATYGVTVYLQSGSDNFREFPTNRSIPVSAIHV